jgi:hypothetical protein
MKASQQNSRRFLRACLAATAMVAVASAAVGCAYVIHDRYQIREYGAIESGNLDIYGYEEESVLPTWLAGRLPHAFASCFVHITEINLQFNDLSVCDPRHVRELHACEWVHTLRIPNATLPPEMFAAVTSFPRLKTIYFRDWFDGEVEGSVDLRKAQVDGVRLIMTR